jgi:hypothetical protein
LPSSKAGVWLDCWACWVSWGALLGPGGRAFPVALHGLDPAATDGDHGRADHDGQDRIPQAGHDPGGDLQLVQGREGPEDQHRDPGPLGHDLPAGHTGQQVGQQISDGLGGRRRDHQEHDGHQHVGQVGDQALEQLAGHTTVNVDSKQHQMSSFELLRMRRAMRKGQARQIADGPQ